MTIYVELFSTDLEIATEGFSFKELGEKLKRFIDKVIEKIKRVIGKVKNFFTRKRDFNKEEIFERRRIQDEREAIRADDRKKHADNTNAFNNLIDKRKKLMDRGEKIFDALNNKQDTLSNEIRKFTNLVLKASSIKEFVKEASDKEFDESVLQIDELDEENLVPLSCYFNRSIGGQINKGFLMSTVLDILNSNLKSCESVLKLCRVIENSTDCTNDVQKVVGICNRCIATVSKMVSLFERAMVRDLSGIEINDSQYYENKRKINDETDKRLDDNDQKKREHKRIFGQGPKSKEYKEYYDKKYPNGRPKKEIKKV